MITASVNALTTAALSNHSHGITVNATGINVTTGGDSNGINLSLSAVAAAQTADTNKAGTGFTTTTQAGAVVLGTNDTNGLKLGVPAFLTTAAPVGALTTARASNDGIGLNTALTANGVSMSANSSGLSLNFPAFLTTAAQSNHSHGNPTLNLTNLSGTTASNSAGFTLSLSAAAGGGGADGYNIVQLGTTGTTGTAWSSSAGTVQINGSQNITVSQNNSNQIVIQGPNLAPYLTTAMQSGSSANFAATGFTTTTAAGAVIAGTHDTAGLKLAVPAFLTTAQAPGAYLTTARASNDAIGLNTALTANGVSWTVNSSGLSFNVPAFLTTAAQSNHSHGNPTLNLTNINGTTASNSAGLTLSLSAIVPSQTVQPAVAQLNGSSGTMSFAVGSSLSASSNASTITFGLASNITTALQSAGAYLTTARASNDAVGLNTALTANGVAWTVNSSGISLNVPAFLTTAAQSSASNVSGVVAGTASNGGTATLSGAVSFSNANGVSFYTSAGNAVVATVKTDYLTTAMVSNAGSNFVGLNSALTANGVSATINSSGISLNVPAFLTTAAQSNHSHGNPTLNLTNLTGTTASNSNGFTLSLSANAPGAAAENNWFTLAGNVVGNSSASGSTIQLIGGSNITLSGLNASQIRIDGAGGGGANYTALSIQNRQLGASTTLNSGGGQNSLWLSPLRVGVAVSASTILAEMVSYSGTITSAATAQAGQTVRVGIWSQLTDPASSSRFDTWWTGAASLTFWNSGTSSVSYAYSLSGGQTTGSSAGSNLLTASVMGVRQILLPIGSTMPAGLYVVGVLNSSSSAGYSAAMSRMAVYFDNPMSIGQGTIGQATNNSLGYADGGTYLTTTGALPNTLALNQIGGVANVMPFFKIGAI